MCKVISVQLEWKYSPKTYLEEPELIEFDWGKLEIKDGVALATIDPFFFQAHPSIKEELTQKIESRLYAILLMKHINFELSSSTLTEILEDGKKAYGFVAGHLEAVAIVDKVDIIVKDKDENIVSDTRRERLDMQNHLAVLIDKYRATDITFNQMLNSYEQAVKDPSDELVYLYEIRDALPVRFGSNKKAITALGITNGEWDQLTTLANDPLLNQGRHRGKAVGTKRNADPAELETARKLARHFIEKYLQFLEKEKSK